jgi:acyl-coenzyme A thioesterase PaaI-like protein
VSESVLTDSDTDSGLRQRRQAVRELGAALRELNEAAVSSEVDTDTLRQIAQHARELVPALDPSRRTRNQLPSVDDLRSGRRMYNPAVGPGNPMAPPMHVEIVDGVAVGTCTLGLSYEGPPSYAHGGMSALLLDQILGHAQAKPGQPSMTAMLSIRYRQPVPLQTPLRIVGQLVESEHPRRTVARATIVTAEAPGTVLVEGEGTFVVPRPDQVRRLFGEVSSTGGD